MHEVVIPREGGGSSTPRLIDSIIDVSGILDHPPSRVMTTEYEATISRRLAPEVCYSPCPLVRGRREDQVLAAPAVSHAICTNKNAHEHRADIFLNTLAGPLLPEREHGEIRRKCNQTENSTNPNFLAAD